MDCNLPSSSAHGILQAREYWSGLPFPPPGDLPIEPSSPALQANSLPTEPPEQMFPMCKALPTSSPIQAPPSCLSSPLPGMHFCPLPHLHPSTPSSNVISSSGCRGGVTTPTHFIEMISLSASLKRPRITSKSRGMTYASVAFLCWYLVVMDVRAGL